MCYYKQNKLRGQQMNSRVIVTADSTCDLPAELTEKYNIHIIPLSVELDGKSYLDGVDFDESFLFEQYRKTGHLPKTAAPGIQSFSDFFAPFLREGYEIIHFDISSELSGTYNNARIAASESEGIYIVDSRSLSFGVGILAVEAAECALRGMSAREIYEHVELLKEHVDTSFVLDTLEFMWKGGRCSGVTALGANVLKLRPALEMHEGKLVMYKKYRGATDKVLRQYLRERTSGKRLLTGHVFIGYSSNIDEGLIDELTEQAKLCFPDAEIHVCEPGCTVATHCGPGALGIIFIKE